MNENSKANQEYYDKVSRTYDNKHTIGTRDYVQFCRDIRDVCGAEIRGKKVLDCGCGTGRGAIKFAILGNRVTAVDISERIVEVCRRNADTIGLHIETVACDCARMPFENETFDVLTTSAALHHFEELNGVLREFWRVLKTGGRVLFIAEPKESFIRPAWMREKKELYSARYDMKTTGYSGPSVNPDVYIFRPDALERKLEKLGFGDIGYRCFSTATSLFRDLVFYRMYHHVARRVLFDFLGSLDRNILFILPDRCKVLFNLTAIKKHKRR